VSPAIGDQEAAGQAPRAAGRPLINGRFFFAAIARSLAFGVRRHVAAFFPRRHVASFQSADMSAHSKRSTGRLAQKLLVRPARAEGDPHGRPLLTCDLVKATSLLVSVLLPHNVNRLWDRAGPQFLQTLAASEPCSAENRLSFSTERDRFWLPTWWSARAYTERHGPGGQYTHAASHSFVGRFI
jgi:hypothetical protein